MKTTVWTFGLISGAILSVMMLATIPFSEQIGFDRAAIIGYTTMVLAFLLVYFGVRAYRDNVGGGTISFGRALAVGALVTLVSSACYVATWEFVFFKLTPDFATRYAAHSIEKVKASGASQAAIDEQIRDMEKFTTMYQNPLYNSALTFLEPLPVGARVRRAFGGGAAAQAPRRGRGARAIGGLLLTPRVQRNPRQTMKSRMRRRTRRTTIRGPMRFIRSFPRARELPESKATLERVGV